VRLSVTGILTRISGEHGLDALEKKFLHLIADQALIPEVMQVFGECGGEAKPVVGLPYGDGAKSGGKFPSFRLDADGVIECGTDDLGRRFEKQRFGRTGWIGHGYVLLSSPVVYR
jgi:hypothetical protein